MAVRLENSVCRADRLRCQLRLLTFATGEHQADCSEAPHGDGGGFGDGG